MYYLFSFYKKVSEVSLRGFILPLTMLICTVILIISSGITTILAKGVYFSRLTRQSQLAYYAADDAMNCAVMIDDKYFNLDTGSGIFPHDSLIDPSTAIQSTLAKVNIERQTRNLSSLTLGDIRCGTSDIFDSNIDTSNFRSISFSHKNSLGVFENGYSSSYSMRMDLGDGTFRCADVVVNKTINYRQIISRGYASCLKNGTQQVERAIVNTTEAI